MNAELAYCGLICQTCPIHLATLEGNKPEQVRQRKQIVSSSLELYGLKFKLEDITDCDGCRTDNGRLFSACKDCPIRTCARERGLKNCATCVDYTCAPLEQFFKSEPACRERLDDLRKTLPLEGK